jgi:hypothetical protein
MQNYYSQSGILTRSYAAAMKELEEENFASSSISKSIGNKNDHSKMTLQNNNNMIIDLTLSPGKDFVSTTEVYDKEEDMDISDEASSSYDYNSRIGIDGTSNNDKEDSHPFSSLGSVPSATSTTLCKTMAVPLNKNVPEFNTKGLDSSLIKNPALDSRKTLLAEKRNQVLKSLKKAAYEKAKAQLYIAQKKKEEALDAQLRQVGEKTLEKDEDSNHSILKRPLASAHSVTNENKQELNDKRVQLLKSKAELEKAKAQLYIAQKKKEEALDAKLRQTGENRSENHGIEQSKAKLIESIEIKQIVEDEKVPSDRIQDIAAYRMKDLIISEIRSSGPQDKVYYDTKLNIDVKMPFLTNRSDLDTIEPIKTSCNNDDRDPIKEEYIEVAVSDSPTRQSEKLKLDIELLKRRLHLKKLTKQKAEKLKSLQATTSNNEKLQSSDSSYVRSPSHVITGAMEVFDAQYKDLSFDNTASAGDSKKKALSDTCDAQIQGLDEDLKDKLHQLRKRHLQLKESIDTSKENNRELRFQTEVMRLNEMVQKQQRMMKFHGTKINESTAALAICSQNIKNEQELLSQSETNLELLMKKEQMMKNLLMSVTKKLVKSRRRREKLLKKKQP